MVRPCTDSPLPQVQSDLVTRRAMPTVYDTGRRASATRMKKCDERMYIGYEGLTVGRGAVANLEGPKDEHIDDNNGGIA